MGIKKGREEGEQIGMAKGEQKLQEEKKNIAHKLRLKGMSIAEISEMTGLSMEEIKSLDL